MCEKVIPQKVNKDGSGEMILTSHLHHLMLNEFTTGIIVSQHEQEGHIHITTEKYDVAKAQKAQKNSANISSALPLHFYFVTLFITSFI